MDLGLEGKAVLITGCSSGIGRATVHRLVESPDLAMELEFCTAHPVGRV